MSKELQKIQVALADDHKLVRSSMVKLVASFSNCSILFDAENGEEVVEKLKKHFIPDILLLDISMPLMAIETVMEKSFYLPEEMSWKLVTGMQKEANMPALPCELTEKEKEFLVHICTELHYDQIAKKMFISPRTLDGYRAALYEKLKVHSRMGLAMYAIKNGLVESLE